MVSQLSQEKHMVLYNKEEWPAISSWKSPFVEDDDDSHPPSAPVLFLSPALVGDVPLKLPTEWVLSVVLELRLSIYILFSRA